MCDLLVSLFTDMSKTTGVVYKKIIIIIKKAISLIRETVLVTLTRNSLEIRLEISCKGGIQKTEEQSTPQWGQQYLCAPWWLNVVIVQIEKGALQKKNVIFSITYYINVG